MDMGPNIAVLWDSEVDWEGSEPFKKDYMNSSYAVFSELAQDKGAEILIGNYSWYEDRSLVKAYRYGEEGWSKVENTGLDAVFDKFRFDNETVQLKKKMHQDLPVLNHFELEKICKDKQLTYEKFPKRVPETREATQKNVEELLSDYDKVVLKPRYDFGGKGISIIDKVDEFDATENLLVQRFIDSKSGIPELGIEGVHDLRVIVVNGEPVTGFVRTPDEGLISNVSRGGSMHHIEIEDIPDSALQIVDEVEDSFSRFGSRVYAVDFIFDENGNPWILEMNSKPGLVFYDDESIRSWKEPLMEKVVETLLDMTD
jgi:glutathione synthase/RimK-type ligase-like ATP-grasp enzyme